MRRCLTTLLVMVASTAAAQTTPAGRTAAPRASTRDGVVAGLVLPSGVHAFRGIPFAAPPVRDLRWKPPQPVRPWAGIRRADRFADQCMQARVFSDMVFRNSGTSEDCLYLNVWTPAATGGAKLPVLVYYFGGGYIAGDGSEPRYDGESMARQGIVAVTVSYRLGVFGFLAHPELTAESPRHASGNYGLLDQAAALRWVRDNIAAFGGDPKRVTIAGESAGSFSVSGLMASPLSRNLIAGAIGESGAFFSTTLSTPALATAEQNGVKFAVGAGATSLADLRARSAMEILAAAMKSGGARIGPDVDGYFFPEQPARIFAAGQQAHVPLLAGWNSEEQGARSVLHDAAATPENVAKVFATTFGADSAEAAKAYPASTADEAAAAARHLASDQWIAYSTWKWLDTHTRTTHEPVYRYYFSRPRPATADGSAPAAQGASHSAEIEYALGNLATNRVYAWTPQDYAVSRTMEGFFANFIKTGNPNGPGLPEWPVGTIAPDGHVMRMRIDVQSRAEPEPRDRYLFLDRFYSAKR